ncbi:hypothetical protein ACEPPN_010214 [Leptodophora sp. 'Broadleaf-Isolate-01']
MPQVNATLEYLQNLPLYDVEKPYWCFFAPRDGFDPNLQRLDNLEFEAHENIPINDLRDLTKKADINECGFQVVPHLILRKNVIFERDIIDLGDPLHIEGPAIGVHNG